MQKRWLKLILLTALWWVVTPAQGEEAVFETKEIRLVLGTNALSQSLVQKSTGQEWLASDRRPFVSVKAGGQWISATDLRPLGNVWRAEFGSTGTRVDFRITTHPDYIIFEIVHVEGWGIEEVRFVDLQVNCRTNAGWWAGAWWDERFAVGLLGLSDRVNVQLLGNGAVAASVYPEFGMEGQKVALVAVPRTQFLERVQEVEREFGLPSPKLGGQWAKASRAVRTGYLFTDLTEANADETIRFANLGGFEYIMTYDSTWSRSLGSYPVNTNNFPRGEPSLKATVDKCHAAGLKVGLHFLTSFVGKNDPLVRPRPDRRLLKDDQGTLASDVDERATDIAAAGSLASFPTEGAFYGDAKSGLDIQIDDELIQYHAVGGPGTNILLKCTRGYAGTIAAPHKRGAKIHHLVERYGSYLADLRTTLKGEISERIAGIINGCGFDMVYFDGGECNMANGPFWYWVSQQQDDVCRRVKRELLVQGSGSTHWTWHWFARGNCDDFAAVAPKEYLDFHKIADAWTAHQRSFMPAEMGWWGFLTDAPDHPATRPDEVEFYAVRMLALDTPVSLETQLDALKRNGRTEEMLGLLGKYEQLRLDRAVPETVREQLRTGEWHLRNENGKHEFVPIRNDSHWAQTPGELVVTNQFEAQPFRFRLVAAPRLSAPGDPTNLVLLAGNPVVDLKPPAAKAPMPGALIEATRFAEPLNVLGHRALAVELEVSPGPPTNNEPCAVLNVQLEASGKTYRDHYIDLNFSGQKTVLLPEPTTKRMLPEFRPADANYAFKAAMYGFDYGHVVALNLRWMRWRKNVECRVRRIEALRESALAITDPQVLVGEQRLSFPVILNVGDYIEYLGDGPARVFDRNGVSLSSIDPSGEPIRCRAGENRVSLRSKSPASLKLTVITAGRALTWD